MGIQRVRQYQSFGMLDDPQSWIRKHLSDHAAEASLRIQDFDHNRLANLHQGVTTTDSPGFVGLTLSGLTAARPVFTDANKALVSATFGTANQMLGMNAAANMLEYKSLTGTANRVTVTHAAGSVTLSGPQDIATTSFPSFYGATFTQQNSMPGLVIKNAATFNPAYPPLIFTDSDGNFLGSMHVDTYENIVVGSYAPPAAGILSNGTYIGSRTGGYIRSGSWNLFIGSRSGSGALISENSTFLASSGIGSSYANLQTILGFSSGPMLEWLPPWPSLAAGTDLEIGEYAYTYSFILDGIETQIGEYSTITTTAGNRAVDLINVPVYNGPRLCTARNLYRTKVGSAENLGKFYLLATIGNNTATTYSDTTADSTLGAQLTKQDNVVVIGNNFVHADMPNTTYIGSGVYSHIPDVVFGEEYYTTPVGITLHSQGGQGANVAGADFTVAAGQGTGTAAGGSFKIKVAPAGAAGSTWNALQDALVIDSTKTITTGIWGATAIGPSKGGTGLSSYAVGDILYAPTTTTVGKLADVATGSVLVSGGVDTAPAYSATPTITTSVTVPSVYGSSSASGDLNLYSTSNGTKGYVIAQDPISVPATGRNLKAQWDFEDFIGKLSQRMWTSGYSGTGALTYDSPGTALRPGIISITTGTTNSGYAYSFLSGTTSASPFLFGGGVYTLETDIYITTLSDGTDTYTYRFGFADKGATAPTDGAYFYYTDVGGGGATPNWYRNTVSNTTLTSTNTSIAVVAGSWIRLKVVVNADATSVEYFINDISAGTNTTNIPSGTGRGTGIFNSIVKSAGTTARIISTDWAWVHVNLTTSR